MWRAAAGAARGYCFSGPCHQGLGSHRKHLKWQWDDINSLSQSTHARGNLGSRKELTEGFLSPAKHGVTGQAPRSGTLLPVPAPPRRGLRLLHAWRGAACSWAANPGGEDAFCEKAQVLLPGVVFHKSCRVPGAQVAELPPQRRLSVSVGAGVGTLCNWAYCWKRIKPGSERVSETPKMLISTTKYIWNGCN